MNPELQPGDVLLCQNSSIVARLIKFGESVRYHGWADTLRRIVARKPVAEDDPCWANHAAVYIGSGRFIEALAGGLTIRTWADHPEGSYRIMPLAAVKPDASVVDRANLSFFAFAQYNRHGPYGWLSIASIVIQILTPAKLDVSWDGALICSAFAAQCLEHAGVTIPTRSSLTTSPADLAAWLDSETKCSPSSSATA